MLFSGGAGQPPAAQSVLTRDTHGISHSGIVGICIHHHYECAAPPSRFNVSRLSLHDFQSDFRILFVGQTPFRILTGNALQSERLASVSSMSRSVVTFGGGGYVDHPGHHILETSQSWRAGYQVIWMSRDWTRHSLIAAVLSVGARKPYLSRLSTPYSKWADPELEYSLWLSSQATITF